MDEFCSANLAQKVTRGMREATSRGFWVVLSTPYGYRRVKVQDGEKWRVKLDPDPNASAIVAKMFRMVESGTGCKETATALNTEGVPSPRGKRWGSGRGYVLC